VHEYQESHAEKFSCAMHSSQEQHDVPCMHLKRQKGGRAHLIQFLIFSENNL
jgi:hypothetical protein